MEFDLHELNQLKLDLAHINVNIKICSPDDKLGEHFIDFYFDKNRILTVAYKLKFGFGFFSEDVIMFECPSEILNYENALIKIREILADKNLLNKST
jgi:hypothetical protein